MTKKFHGIAHFKCGIDLPETKPVDKQTELMQEIEWLDGEVIRLVKEGWIKIAERFARRAMVLRKELKQRYPDLDTVVDALREVANMTVEEEARLNQIVLEDEAKIAVLSASN